jgi:hypothetical protein
MVKIIKLKAKTKLGSQKLKNHGDTWSVLSESTKYMVAKSMTSNLERLMQIPADEHFEIVSVSDIG